MQAVVVSDIAHSDWPDEWPSLMSQLLSLVSSPSQLSVEGGMRVLKDFVGIDLTEDQLLPIAREMLPQLLSILGAPDAHSPTTRARAVLIFRQCIMTLFTVREEHPEAVKGAIAEIMPMWLDAFRQLLQVDVVAELGQDNWDGIAIRIAIFHVSLLATWLWRGEGALTGANSRADARDDPEQLPVDAQVDAPILPLARLGAPVEPVPGVQPRVSVPERGL